MGPRGKSARARAEAVGSTDIVATEVGLQLAREYLERGALTNTVRPDEPEHLAWTWGRESVELERVGCVAMGDLRVEVRRQVDDGDGLEWASDIVSWRY